MRSKVSSDRMPSYIKATRQALEIFNMDGYFSDRPRIQGRRLRVASGATAPGPALEGAPRFRPMCSSSYILR